MTVSNRLRIASESTQTKPPDIMTISELIARLELLQRIYGPETAVHMESTDGTVSTVYYVAPARDGAAVIEPGEPIDKQPRRRPWIIYGAP